MQPGSLPIIGWREWVGLPGLGVKKIKAKVDSGARSSSLHASGIEEFTLDQQSYVRFFIHPNHKNVKKKVPAQARLVEMRSVRSSSGETSQRPVVKTAVRLLGQIWQVELTLADRSDMGFRMLLGREAFRGKFLVDAASSFYGGQPRRRRK